MSDYRTRKEALEFAIMIGSTGANLLGNAQAIEEYLHGTNDSEILAAARALAEKVRGGRVFDTNKTATEA